VGRGVGGRGHGCARKLYFAWNKPACDSGAGWQLLRFKFCRQPDHVLANQPVAVR